MWEGGEWVARSVGGRGVSGGWVVRSVEGKGVVWEGGGVGSMECGRERSGW